MPWNGIGTFNVPEAPEFPAVAGELIRAEYFNTIIRALCEGFSNTLPRDGQAAVTGNIDMDDLYTLVNLKAAVAAGQAVRYQEFAELFTPTGLALMHFLQAGTGAVSRSVQDVLREQHSCYNFFLATDATAEGMINRAIAAYNRVALPAGVYSINTDVGIKVITGTVITGDGMNKTVLSAVLGNGGTIAELAAYTKGSVIKREFVSAGPNSYVNDVYMSDFSIVLNHPLAAITTTKIQIGFDMRNITLSTIERCHSGNIPTVGGPVAAKATTKDYLVQGYPVVFGSVAAVSPAYAGGESNRLFNCYIVGGYKCVIQDDTALSGSSASYGTMVRDCKIETGHWLIGQMGQYGAGNSHIGNSLNDIKKQNGDASSSYVQYYDGYNNYIRPTYIEAGSGVDYQLYLDSDANNNCVEMLMASVTSGAGAIVDNGGVNSYNRITHHGVAGTGALVRMYNKALMSCWVKFHWDSVAVAIVIDGAVGVSGVTRTGVGDYVITWEFAFSSDDYGLTVSLDTDASARNGGFTIRSHATSNVRVDTYMQVAGVTTQIDPRFVWVGANQ